MTRTATVELSGLGVPESLRWHDRALWFSDLAHGTVHRWDGSGAVETIVNVPGRAGGLGWLPDGRLLVVSMDGHCVYRLEGDGRLVEHADLRQIAGGPVNDMLVDAAGRAYVGNFGFDYHGAVKSQANAMLYAPPGPPRASRTFFFLGSARRPSRCSFLRASLRVRRMASAFWRLLRSDGFS